MNKEICKSIYNKRLEIHYDEKFIIKDKQKIKIKLKGKIRCPVLNIGISPLVCSKLMDSKGYPRNLDKEICDKCNCRIKNHILNKAKRK